MGKAPDSRVLEPGDFFSLPQPETKDTPETSPEQLIAMAEAWAGSSAVHVKPGER
jgi:hypothetical protein